MKTVIVGGVAGGASAAARLRRLNEEAEIVLLEKGEYISFANCGLPYYVGGVITNKKDLTVQTPEGFSKRYKIDVRTKSVVVSVNAASKTVTVLKAGEEEPYTESYDALILAPGAKPVRPPIPGADNSRVFVLRNIPDTMRIAGFIEREKPKTALIVGGGYIGVEMAENLRAKGLDVTIADVASHVIAPLDAEMAIFVQEELQKNGVTLMLQNGVQAIKEKKDAAGLEVALQRGSVSADMVIMAVGVKPDTDFLRESGIALNSRGAIVVDERMRTNFQGVYAAGDAVQVKDFVAGGDVMIPLAGPANKQGRIVADNLCGIKSVYKGTQGSAILKVFGQTVATTGVNELAAGAAGLAYDKVYLSPPNHAGYYPGGQMLHMKVLFEHESGRILGTQVVGGPGADKRCDVLATVIRFGGTAQDLTELELCYAPPYSSAKDPVNLAGYMIENVRTGLVKQFHWNDVANLPRDGSVQLVDARRLEEYTKGHMDGFENIPLDEMRQSLAKLDKAKPVYVNCQSGQRSYVAARLLAENGYEVYNLAGGYAMYDAIANAGVTMQ